MELVSSIRFDRETKTINKSHRLSHNKVDRDYFKFGTRDIGDTATNHVSAAPLTALLRSDQLLRKRSRLTARAIETDNAPDKDKTYTYLNNKSSKLTKGGRGGEPFNFDPRDIQQNIKSILKKEFMSDDNGFHEIRSSFK